MDLLPQSIIKGYSSIGAAYRFGTFEYLKGHAVDKDGNLSPLMRMLCGLGAGLSSLF